MTFRRRLWQKNTESQRIRCPLYGNGSGVSLDRCRVCADLGEVKEHGVECGLRKDSK